MSQEPHKNNIVLIIIAIIGVCGTIIGATITTMGNINVEKIRQEAELTRISLVSSPSRGTPTPVTILTTSVSTYPPTGIYATPPTLIQTNTPASVSLLRYDGLYRLVDENSIQNLRFYNDGTVLSAHFTSTSTPEQAAVVLIKANMDQNIGSGQYEIQDSIIKFTVTVKGFSPYEYTGTINGEELILDIDSIYMNPNNKNTTFTYQFVEVPNMQP